MRERLSVKGPQRILVPSLLAAFLPFVLLPLPPGHWRSAPLIAAGILTVGIVAVAVRESWGERSSTVSPALSYAYLIVVVLLRAAGGASGVSAMVLLPVFWMALEGTRRQLWVLLTGVALMFVLPVILVGGRDYPSSAWRAGIVFVILSGIVGTTVQALVRHVRAQDRERNQLMHQLEELAHTDELTGLPNRRAWRSELERGLARAHRTGEPLSMAAIDIDSFKTVNDRDGHPAGDALLVTVAQLWAEVLRPDDVLARVGGDEFALLMPACHETEAEVVIERLRAAMPSPHSCSIGLAAWDGAELAAELMSRSDGALYAAKRERHEGRPTTVTDTWGAGHGRAPTTLAPGGRLQSAAESLPPRIRS